MFRPLATLAGLDASRAFRCAGLLSGFTMAAVGLLQSPLITEISTSQAATIVAEDILVRWTCMANIDACETLTNVECPADGWDCVLCSDWHPSYSCRHSGNPADTCTTTGSSHVNCGFLQIGDCEAGECVNVSTTSTPCNFLGSVTSNC